MVARVIHGVTEHLAEAMEKLATGGWLDRPRLGEPRVREVPQERGALRFYFFPARAHSGERGQVLALRHLRVWRAEPAAQPQLLGPHNVGQRPVDPAVAAPQVPEVVLLRECRGGGEQLPVRP